MADTLAQRLAATLAAHSTVDQSFVVQSFLVDAPPALSVEWHCTCGAAGVAQIPGDDPPSRVQAGTDILAEARAHVAGHLAETVATWLEERAALLDAPRCVLDAARDAARGATDVQPA